MSYKREIPLKTRVAIFKKYDGKCAECGVECTGDGIKIVDGKERVYLGNLAIHHNTQYIIGGKHTEDNLVLLCNKCHANKHRKAIK